MTAFDADEETENLTMNLDEAQKQKVIAWIDEGQTVSDIQKRLMSEFGIQMTYLEVRLLLDDLRLKPKDKEPPSAVLNGLQSQGPESGAAAAAGLADDTPDTTGSDAKAEADTLGGGVSVTVDKVTRPGAVVSGSVTFGDGNGATWHLDQMGRLGLAPKVQGYRPSEDDLLAFQTELQQQLARMGY
jgi:hypothetical protein